MAPREHRARVVEVEHHAVPAVGDQVLDAGIGLVALARAPVMVEHDDVRGLVGELAQILVVGRDVDEHDRAADVRLARRIAVVTARHIARIGAPRAPHRPRGAEAVGAARMEVTDAIHRPKLAEDRSTRCDTVARGAPVSRPPRCTALVSLPAPDDLDPPGALERLRDAGAPWLLESALPMRGIGRFSFAGADPYLILRARGRDLEIECRRAVYEGLVGRNVSRARPRARGPARAPSGGAAASECALPFCGGAVGVFGYELAEQLDVHALHGADDLALPDAVWLFVDALIGFDHEQDRAQIVGDRRRTRRRDRARARAARRTRARAGSSHPAARRAARRGALRAPASAHAEFDVAGYRKAVEAIADAIAAGELYQACLTYRIDRAFAGDPWQLYRALRRRDPAPFAAYLELPEVAIASSSPERFLRVDAARRVESRPIKGTATRSGDPAQDALAAPRARGLREGPRRERDDRRPGAQRSRAACARRAASQFPSCSRSSPTPRCSSSSRPSPGGCAPSATRSTRSRPRSRPAR